MMTARKFYAALVLYAIAASLLQLHGSSISMYAAYFPTARAPLVGTPKGIRSDEWLTQTPQILHQLLRDDPLSLDKSPSGPGGAALMWNIPVKHSTALFRPQLWPFFIFAPAQAFSIYWQCKTLLLLAGTFALFHLITGSAVTSAVLALFLYFSPHMQWGFSWPSGLPEMIGSACLAVVLGCRTLVARTPSEILRTGIGTTFFAINFILCCYAPHLIAIAWVGFAVLAWWLVTRWRSIIETPFVWWRLAAGGAGASMMALVMTAFYIDAQEAIAITLNTVYPGQRRMGGGGVSVFWYASHFLDFWKTPENTANPLTLNVVEASGFYWFAPLTLIFAHRLEPGRTRVLYLCLCAVFALFSIWIFFPVRPSVGQPFGLDLVGSQRIVVGMGLLNASILAAFFASYRRPALSPQGAVALGAMVFSAFLLTLLHVNALFGLGLRLREVATAAAFPAAVMACLALNLRLALSILLVVPLALATALVNPIDRKLDIILQSDLATFLRERPDLRQKKWLVFSDIVGPNYFSAHGLYLYNSFRLVPELPSLQKLDPEGKFFHVYNSHAFLVAEPQEPGKDIGFVNVQLGVLRMTVSPVDPRLREIGISVLAFRPEPPATWVAGLKRISTIGNYVLYEFP